MEIDVIDEATAVVQERKERYQIIRQLVLAHEASPNPRVQAAAQRLETHVDLHLRAEVALIAYAWAECYIEACDVRPELPVGLVPVDIRQHPALAGVQWFDPRAGFAAVLFQSLVNDEFILVFVGKAGCQLRDLQVSHLAHTARAALGRLSLVGHALGGALVVKAARESQLSGFTFNGAGLYDDPLRRNGDLQPLRIPWVTQVLAYQGELLNQGDESKGLVLPGLVGDSLMLFAPEQAVKGGVASRCLACDGPPLSAAEDMAQIVAALQKQNTRDIDVLVRTRLAGSLD
jgi:hypothetical protein